MSNLPAYLIQVKMQSLKDKWKSFYPRDLFASVLSPCVILALLTLKIDGSQCMFLDSHAINEITIKYWFSIPWINGLLDLMAGSYIFSKIDLKGGYHQIKAWG